MGPKKSGVPKKLVNKYAIIKIKHEKKFKVVKLSKIVDFDEQNFEQGEGKLKRYDFAVEDGGQCTNKRVQVLQIGGDAKF